MPQPASPLILSREPRLKLFGSGSYPLNRFVVQIRLVHGMSSKSKSSSDHRTASKRIPASCARRYSSCASAMKLSSKSSRSRSNQDFSIDFTFSRNCLALCLSYSPAGPSILHEYFRQYLPGYRCARAHLWWEKRFCCCQSTHSYYPATSLTRPRPPNSFFDSVEHLAACRRCSLS